MTVRQMAAALADIASALRSGLGEIGQEIGGGAAKERVSLSRNGATIATVAENENELMSSVMKRLKEENSDSDIFIVSEDEEKNLTDGSFVLSYSINDGSKSTSEVGLVLTKSREELYLNGCTVGSLRIVGSSDIRIEISIKEKPKGNSAAELF
mmetsp:Transcript_26025/g.75205  ORF Transcript_26025/g.75205 Transcript_26025/m.75205 type:complete len:154 (-) Transcript_26025:140-601(-)|eukprot:CAMPEP_0181053362 /NCGR_PEP_ID=MMETSP1070-20121207/18070_1 /TAXON_ID=265543 /ORGANISM="Minutocellus polymorphus, Strain NH13" /LENGTH=153 /DNA_ID=CAMNT_0023132491 /DNA_START=386 /DNA_END=847 /DNA_ORIENTATION=+